MPEVRSLKMLFFKNLVFTVLVPGTVAVWVPYRLLGPSRALELRQVTGLRWLGLVPWVCGAALYFWCVWSFARVGRGTPAPIDPPRTLVGAGAYRYTRNPMYVAVLGMIFGEAALWGSMRLVLYGLAIWAAFHAFVVLYEEPTLRSLFGRDYERYLTTVPRWFPLAGHLKQKGSPEKTERVD